MNEKAVKLAKKILKPIMKESAKPRSPNTRLAIQKIKKHIFPLSEAIEVPQGKKDSNDNELITHLINVIKDEEYPFCLRDFASHLPIEVAIKMANKYLKDGISVAHHKMPLSNINWFIYEKSYRTESFQLQSWQFIDNLIAAYRETKQSRYIDSALDCAISWVDNFIIQGKHYQFAWYDMAVGLRALKLPTLIYYAAKTNKPDNIQKLIYAAHVHNIELSDRNNLVRNSNHGFFQLIGLLSLGKCLQFLKHADDSYQYACKEIAAIVEKSFGNDGLHNEHSPDYHYVFVIYFYDLLESGWVDKESLNVNFIKKIINNAAWLVMPDFRMITLGDTKGMNVRQRLPLNVNMQDKDCYLGYLYDHGRSGNHPDKNLSWFNDGGLVIIREHWKKHSELLYLSAAFHSRVHKHADDFTFGWYNGEKPVIIDSGTYKYVYDDPYRQYAESTRAHNTVEIDNKDYSRYALDAFGSAIKHVIEHQGIYIIEAELYRKRFFKTHHRRTLFYQPRRFLIVFDYLTSPTYHSYTQWFHYHPDYHITLDGNKFLGIDTKTGHRLHGQTIIVNAELKDICCIKGQVEPRIQGWSNVSNRNDIMEPSYAVGIQTEGRDVGIFTLFSLSGNEQVVNHTNISSKGKYIRFLLDNDIDLTYRIQGEKRILNFNGEETTSVAIGCINESERNFR